MQFTRKIEKLLVPHWFQLQAAPLLGSSVLEPVVPVVPVVLFVSKRIPQLAVIDKAYAHIRLLFFTGSTGSTGSNTL